MIQSTNGGWLWLTLHPVTDLASKQPLLAAFSGTSLSPSKAQEAALCQQHKWALFSFTRPPHPKVNQLVRTRRPGSWMESCPPFWQSHTGALLFPLLSFSLHLFPFYPLSLSLSSSFLSGTLHPFLQIYICTHMGILPQGLLLLACSLKTPYSCLIWNQASTAWHFPIHHLSWWNT